MFDGFILFDWQFVSIYATNIPLGVEKAISKLKFEHEVEKTRMFIELLFRTVIITANAYSAASVVSRSGQIIGSP